MKMGLIAGEKSGDNLGADFIKTFKKSFPDTHFEGVAGSGMIEAGCKPLYSMDHLSVMGLIEPLKKLPSLMKMRHKLCRYFLKHQPDLFMGIDAPDFNLGLEVALRRRGIKVAHYVSPSVWAWRQGRIHKIKKAVDLMLTLFPFETEIYERHDIPVKFVGHPLADRLPMKPDTLKAREKLCLNANDKILCLLPGSRAMELKHLAATFIETAERCLRAEPNLVLITSMVDTKRYHQFMQIVQKTAPRLPIKIYENSSYDAMTAANALLLGSGTVTLEGMLLKKPMVVAYRMAAFNYFLAKRLVKLDHFSLPNLIAKENLVPEFLQEEARPDVLSTILLDQLHGNKESISVVDKFYELHRLLKCNASQQVTAAIKDLLVC